MFYRHEPTLQETTYKEQLEAFTQRHQLASDDTSHSNDASRNDNNIYHNNIIAAKERVLHHHFLVTHHVLSLTENNIAQNKTAAYRARPSMMFAGLARVYASHYPSRQWDINLFGEHFCDFIAAQKKPISGLNWNTLADIAALEYALVCAYYSHDAYRHVIDLPYLMRTRGYHEQFPRFHPYCRWFLEEIPEESPTQLVVTQYKNQLFVNSPKHSIENALQCL